MCLAPGMYLVPQLTGGFFASANSCRTSSGERVTGAQRSSSLNTSGKDQVYEAVFEPLVVGEGQSSLGGPSILCYPLYVDPPRGL